MATRTNNLGLIQPGYTDPTDVTELNYNMAAIDAAFGELMAQIAALRVRVEEMENASGT